MISGLYYALLVLDILQNHCLVTEHRICLFFDRRNSRLVIGKAKEEDSGDYRCHGVSAVGNASSKIVKINVNNGLIL